MYIIKRKTCIYFIQPSVCVKQIFIYSAEQNFQT